MRGRTTLFVALLTIGLHADFAQAQFSPQAFLGNVSRPLRQLLGRLGHYPRGGGRRTAIRRPAASVAAVAAGGFAGAEAARPASSSQPQLAATGPIAWPTAFEDVLGYTFWPGEYAGQVRGHGFDIVALAVAGSPRGPSTARASMPNVRTDADDNSAASACGNDQDAQITWPISQIEQTGELNDAQRAALGKLQAALAESVNNMKSSCRGIGSLSPIGRLHATVQSLWAVRDAAIYARAPLKAFYDTLSDEQKARFDSKQPGREDAVQNGRPDDGAMARQYQACASPSLEASERLMRQIEQQVRLRKEQSPGMEALRKTSSDTAKLMTTSCAQPIPADPLARIDAANNELSTLSYAATSMEMALDGFYAQLDDGQKAKFNSLGR